MDRPGKTRSMLQGIWVRGPTHRREALVVHGKSLKGEQEGKIIEKRTKRRTHTSGHGHQESCVFSAHGAASREAVVRVVKQEGG